MPLDWAPFVDFVRRHQRFLLTTHVRPDGDGLGSTLALLEVLEGLGKKARLVIASPLPPRYAFLDPERRRIEAFAPPGEPWRKTDAVVVMDTGTWNQLGPFADFLKGLPAERAVIDHHQTQDDLGALRFVDVSAEATGRLAHEAITALGGTVTESVASHLFIALAMDTGWFRHSNTSPATFQLAADLVRAGARPEKLFDLLYESNTLPRTRLTGRVLERLQLAEGGRVAYTEVHRDDYAATGAVPGDTEDLVNYARGLAGVEVGLLLMEQPRGGVKVSFRSRGVDVARVAEQFGGGGHRLAAGAVLETSLEEARTRVLNAVHTALAAG